MAGRLQHKIAIITGAGCVGPGWDNGRAAERVARIPLGFMGDGREADNGALLLEFDEPRFVTATELVVDGGMSARCD